MVGAAALLRAAPRTTLEGIEKHLAPGMIKGIGPVHAHKLVQAFGETVLDTIEQAPGRLREVAGIGPKRAERIRNGWAEPKVIREIMLFLHRHGVGTSRAVRTEQAKQSRRAAGALLQANMSGPISSTMVITSAGTFARAAARRIASALGAS